MLKRLCDYCNKEIKLNREECKINILVKNGCSSNLVTIGQELKEMDFCEKCIEEIYTFILKGKEE